MLWELLVAPPEPAADRSVVAGGVGESLVREPVSSRGRELPGLLELAEDGVIALGPHHDRDEAMVLRRRPDHRRPADVDVLDRLLLGHVQAGNRALERIQVGADQVDLLDPLLPHRLRVLGVVADAEQASVQLRMKRLHTTVEDLRGPGQILDRANLHSRLFEHRRRPSGGDHLHPQLCEARGELGDGGLVCDRDQRPANGQRLAGRLRDAL